MELSRKADYALRATVELAANKEGCVSTKDLSRLTQSPYAFMTKIVSELSAHKLVEVLRGRDGGVKLAGDSKKISAMQVVEAVSGPLNLNRCINDPRGCSRSSCCSVHDVLLKAQSQLSETLSISLHELARSQCPKEGGKGKLK